MEELPKAKKDRVYCVSDECTKECWRKVDNWSFDEGLYIFMDCCEEYTEDQ